MQTRLKVRNEKKEEIIKDVEMGVFKRYFGYSDSPEKLQEEVEDKHNVTILRISKENAIMMVIPKTTHVFSTDTGNGGIFLLRLQKYEVYKIVMRISIPEDRRYRRKALWGGGIEEFVDTEINMPVSIPIELIVRENIVHMCLKLPK